MIQLAPPNFEYDHLLIIIYNLLCAVNHLHTAGIVHGNLSEKNIYIDEECFVKLNEFTQSCNPGQNTDFKKNKNDCKIPSITWNTTTANVLDEL